MLQLVFKCYAVPTEEKKKKVGVRDQDDIDISLILVWKVTNSRCYVYDQPIHTHDIVL
jgi:hypothetical protein